MIQSRTESISEIREAAQELIRILENSQVHHGHPHWLSKIESFHIWKGVYDLAITLSSHTD